MNLLEAAERVKSASEAGTTVLDITALPADEELERATLERKQRHHLRVRCTRTQHAAVYALWQEAYRWESPADRMDITRLAGLPIEYADE